MEVDELNNSERMEADKADVNNDLKLKFLSSVKESRPATPIDHSSTSTPTSSQTPQSVNPCIRVLAKAVLQVLPYWLEEFGLWIYHLRLID